MNSHRRRYPFTSAGATFIATVAAAMLATADVTIAAVRSGDSPASRNVRAQAEQYVDYSSSIRLTPEQERIKAKALDQIAAPCCKDYTTRTCCCPCNLAKSIWGLSNYLIAKKGYTASQVKRAVNDWLAFVNTKGFTGNACFSGGCKRPFARNGCGGMEASQLILGDDVR